MRTSRRSARFPFAETARRIAAILLLSPALDANYRAAKRATSDLGRVAEA